MLPIGHTICYADCFLCNLIMYEVCPEGIQPRNMTNRDIYLRRYKKHNTQDNDASVPFKVDTLVHHIVLPIVISCPVISFWISWMVWNLIPFKNDFSFRKSQKSHGTISGLSGDWVTWVIWCFTKKLCMRCYAWAGMLLCWSCQSPVAYNCGLLNHANSFHGECSSLMQNLMQIRWSAHSVILTVMATQYTCSLKDAYHPHWLLQWSPHCSLSSEQWRSTFQSTLLGCQFTSMLHKLFLLY